ncbi:MAG: hypothetical protein QY319_04630 [Candidatus Kapaibacterium sp.]|nr:MAG: hypothetical protein F9K28_09550 [Bacteroidota bacterium]MBW7853728.1 hypothetical protein [Candidatus Kapabacteria bacterium]MCC6331520.1 hypothetical protein [Ignavibacteria bacterium]MBZ0194220.1 hypothetical protein [Candidatus Kapabacteria bacterium]MCL4277879.1 hypothetical protein [Ignavibacteria bacterium]
MRFVSVFLVLVLGLLSAGCYNYLERPRPMYMRCPVEKNEYMRSAINIFENNGYKIIEADTASGILMVRDSITEVAYRYTALTRTWRIRHFTDSVEIQVWSVSSRMDGSDVTQTWDKKWGDEIVKDWMRPVMIALESTCGLGSPLAPRP